MQIRKLRLIKLVLIVALIAILIWWFSLHRKRTYVADLERISNEIKNNSVNFTPKMNHQYIGKKWWKRFAYTYMYIYELNKINEYAFPIHKKLWWSFTRWFWYTDNRNQNIWWQDYNGKWYILLNNMIDLGKINRQNGEDLTSIIKLNNNVYYSIVKNKNEKKENDNTYSNPYNSQYDNDKFSYIKHINLETKKIKTLLTGNHAFVIDSVKRDYLIYYEDESYWQIWWRIPLPNYYVLNLKTWSITSLGQVKHVSIGWLRNIVYYRILTEEKIECDTQEVGCYGSYTQYKKSKIWYKELE